MLLSVFFVTSLFMSHVYGNSLSCQDTPVDTNLLIQDFQARVYKGELNIVWTLPENVHVRKLCYKVETELCDYLLPKWLIVEKNISCLDAPPYTCTDATMTSCHVSKDDYYDPVAILIKVNITHIYSGASMTTEQLLDPLDYNEPVAVTSLSVHSTDGRCVRLQWVHQTSDVDTFNISMTSSCDVMSVAKTTKIVSSYDVTLCQLTPHAYYTFDIRARVRHMGQERGYWSKWLDHPVTILTTSDVADSSTSSASLYYELQDHHHIVIYWQPLRRCQLNSRPESVHYAVGGVVVKHPGSHATIAGPLLTRPMNVSITAYNDVGPAGQSSVLTVFPENMAPSPPEMVVEYNGTTKCRYVTLLGDTATHGSLVHTLVWCTGRRRCQVDLPIKSLRLNSSHTALLDNHCHEDYRYGIVTQGQVTGQGHGSTTSGIRWTDCQYELGKVPDTPLSPVLFGIQPATGVTISWEPYQCWQDIAGYITNYLVYYCVDTSGHCQCETVNRTLPRDARRFTSPGNPGETLCLWVRGQSLAGLGPFPVEPIRYTVSRADKNRIPIFAPVVLGTFVVIGVSLFAIRQCCQWWKRKYDEASRIRDIMRVDSSPEISDNEEKDTAYEYISEGKVCPDVNMVVLDSFIDKAHFVKEDQLMTFMTLEKTPFVMQEKSFERCESVKLLNQKDGINLQGNNSGTYDAVDVAGESDQFLCDYQQFDDDELHIQVEEYCELDSLQDDNQCPETNDDSLGNNVINKGAHSLPHVDALMENAQKGVIDEFNTSYSKVEPSEDNLKSTGANSYVILKSEGIFTSLCDSCSKHCIESCTEKFDDDLNNMDIIKRKEGSTGLTDNGIRNYIKCHLPSTACVAEFDSTEDSTNGDCVYMMEAVGNKQDLGESNTDSYMLCSCSVIDMDTCAKEQ